MSIRFFCRCQFGLVHRRSSNTVIFYYLTSHSPSWSTVLLDQRSWLFSWRSLAVSATQHFPLFTLVGAEICMGKKKTVPSARSSVAARPKEQRVMAIPDVADMGILQSGGSRKERSSPQQPQFVVDPPSCVEIGIPPWGFGSAACTSGWIPRASWDASFFDLIFRNIFDVILEPCFIILGPHFR